jgi:hypothetical protein
LSTAARAREVRSALQEKKRMEIKAENLDNLYNRLILVFNKLPEMETLSFISGNKTPRIVYQSWVFF